MKIESRLVVAAVLLLTTFPARAALPDPQPLRECLKQVWAPSPGQESQAKRCYEMASPNRYLDSVSWRALYLESLYAYAIQSPNNGAIAVFRKMTLPLTSYYHAALEPQLPTDRITKLSTEALTDAVNGLTLGLGTAAAVWPKSVGADRVEWIYQELKARGQMTAALAKKLHLFWLLGSDWPKLARLAEEWPELGPVPRLKLPELSEGLAYYQLSSDQQQLTLVPAEIQKGPRILIFGDCHNAFDAFKVLSAHSEFTQAMKQYGLVVSGPGESNFAEIDRIRKAYPEFEIHLIHRSGVWAESGFNSLISPKFYFLRDGHIMEQFDGNSADLTQRFCAGLRKIGAEALCR